MTEVDSTPLPAPSRAVAIAAHPDDAEFGSGGTLAKWAGEGAEVTIVVVTDGSKGTWDRAIPPAELAVQRRREQAEAAEHLGVSRVVHLDHTDGELGEATALREQLCLQIRLLRPDVLLSHDPWRPYEVHPDHRITGLAAVDAMVAARDHLFYPEQRLEPHRPNAMLLWQPGVADHWEDIAATLDAKVAALLSHRSQAQTSMMDWDTTEDGRSRFHERVRAWAEEAAAAAGLELAEAFKKLIP